MRRYAPRMLIWLGLVVSVACGSETIIALEVDLTDFVVPDEIDLIHVELSDDTGARIGHNFDLDEGENRPLIDLIRGPRVSREVDLVVHAFKATQRVSSSAPEHVSFRNGETREVEVKVSRP